MTGCRLFTCSAALLISSLTGSAAQLAHIPFPGLPAVAEKQLFADDRGHYSEASQRFTALLRRKFPSGFDETRLAHILLDQDFHYPPPPKPGCILQKDVSKMPVGQPFVSCPTYDLQRTLMYEWRPTDLPAMAQLVCGQHLSINWQAKGGKLTSIQGHYDML